VSAAGPSVVRVAFNITPDDLVDASRAYNQNIQRNAVIVGGVIAVLGAVVWLLFENLIGPVLAVFGLLAVVSGKVRFVDKWLILRATAHRVGKRSEFRLDDAGIHFTEEGVSASYDWSMVTEIREDERAILILHGPQGIAGIPKRAFASPAEIETLRQLILDRAPTARLVGGPT
jgi:hypothetical protein